MSVCSSGANRRNHQIEKNGCLSQARNDYGSGWSTVALHLAKRHQSVDIGFAKRLYKRAR
jgi:hypothetical protein